MKDLSADPTSVPVFTRILLKYKNVPTVIWLAAYVASSDQNKFLKENTIHRKHKFQIDKKYDQAFLV